MNHPKPLDFTVTLGPFCDLAVSKIKWAWESISEDSRLTIYRMLNEEIWTCFLENVVEKTSFTSRAAAQMLFDVQSGLIPLLQSAFVPSAHLLKADSPFKHFDVVKSAVSFCLKDGSNSVISEVQRSCQSFEGIGFTECYGNFAESRN
jgi:hypothetical protein